MKNLDSLLAPYKHFSLSTPEDNLGIIDFFKTVTMDTRSFSLRYDRGTDFFEFTREQSDKCFVFLMKDDSGTIRGCASIAIIPHLMNGKYELCAYLGDLRISSKLSSKIRILWKKCYGEIISEFNQLEEFIGINFLYSAILNENQNAMRSLLKNNNQLYYHELTDYQTYSIFASMPLQKTSIEFTIHHTSELEIRSFLAKCSTRSGMNYFIQSDLDANDELKRRLESWSNFSISDFLVVKNNFGKIVATTAPWISESKKLVIEKMNLPLKIIGMLVPILRIPKILEKSPIKIMYLTHLTFDQNITNEQKKEIMILILTKLLKSKKRNFHLISFFTFPDWQLDSLPFFKQVTHAKFYQVMSKDQYENKEFFNLENEPPAFELGIA